MEAHQGFNHQTIQSFISKEEKFKFIMFGMKLFKKFKLYHMFFFSKFIQMLQKKTWSWSLFNNVFKKIIIIYKN